MNKLRNLFVVLVVVAGAGYGGLKLYLHFKVKNGLDDVLREARPFVDVQYDGLSVGMDGRIKVTDLVFQPAPTADRLTAQSVEVHIDGLVPSLLWKDNPMERGELPNDFRLSVRGFALPADSQLMQRISNAQIEQARRRGRQPIPPGCRMLDNIGGKEYQALGMDTVIVDVEFRFHRTDGGTFNVSANYDVRGVRELTVRGSFIGRGLGLSTGPNRELLLTGLSITERPDQSFHKTRIEYCARRSDMTVEQYVDAVVEQSDRQFANQFHFVPGVGLKTALKQYMRDGSPVEISAQPEVAVNLVSLAGYRPKDIVDRLDISVKVGDHTVEDLSFAEPGTSGPTAGSSGSTGASNGGSDAEPQARYISVAKRDLSQHRGAQARVYTRDGHVRQGVIKGVRNDNLALERRMYGGAFTVHVPLGDIQKAEVWAYPSP